LRAGTANACCAASLLPPKRFRLDVFIGIQTF
jgi:hypothetical protein